MQKVINVIALLSGVTSLSVIAGGTKDMNLEALREIRRQHGTLVE